MREAFAIQKLLSFFQQKSISIFQILMFEIVTNDVFSFEQLDHGIFRNAVILSKIIFLLSKSHMHIFNMLIIPVQSFKLIA